MKLFLLPELNSSLTLWTISLNILQFSYITSLSEMYPDTPDKQSIISPKNKAHSKITFKVKNVRTLEIILVKYISIFCMSSNWQGRNSAQPKPSGCRQISTAPILALKALHNWNKDNRKENGQYQFWNFNHSNKFI